MIYFARIEASGYIKIGYAENVKVRMANIAHRCRSSVTVLATGAGGRQREAEIHAKFAGLRIGRPEHFRPEPELMEFIDRLVLDEPIEDPRYSDLSPVKIDRKLKEQAEAIAKRRGIPTAQLLSEMLDGPIDRAYLDLMHDLERRVRGGGK